MKEVKLPSNPCEGNGLSRVMCELYKEKLLQFFVDFLNEHIELHKENKWNTVQFEALKINFQSRFMDRK